MATRSIPRSHAWLRLKVLFCCTLVSSACSIGKGTIEAHGLDHSMVVTSYADSRLHSLLSQLDPLTTLFVFDIDNTLLMSPVGQFTGSDQWYRWQVSLNDDDPRRVECLFDVQGLIFSITELDPTEGGVSTQFIRKVQSMSFPTIALTARSPAFRYSTERELSRNSFELSASLPDEASKELGHYLPARSDFIRSPRIASYRNGVAMLAGQHKGGALLDLLQRLNLYERFNAVVFIDDDEKNTKAVSEAFAIEPISAFSVVYKAVDTGYDDRLIDSSLMVQNKLTSLLDEFKRSEGCNL